MRLRYWPAIFFSLTFCAPKSILYPTPVRMVVVWPVVDIRSDQSQHGDRYEYDDRQETQVLKGETVLLKERRGAWARVECEEQPEFTHSQKWEGYPGWIRWRALSNHQSLASFPERTHDTEDPLRMRLLNEAKRHLGTRYLWGGRSLHDEKNKDVLTGVDCSGLVNWSFRQIGWVVPRDAHEQFMKSEKRDVKELKPGDLFFLAKKEKPEKIVHVGFISGPNQLLEAPQSGDAVREITFQERFGMDLKDLKNGQVVGDRVIAFGTLFTGGL